jgi:hypothetical protein
MVHTFSIIYLPSFVELWVPRMAPPHSPHLRTKGFRGQGWCLGCGIWGLEFVFSAFMVGQRNRYLVFIIVGIGFMVHGSLF